MQKLFGARKGSRMIISAFNVIQRQIVWPLICHENQTSTAQCSEA